MKSDTCENQRPERYGTLKWGWAVARNLGGLEACVGERGCFRCDSTWRGLFWVFVRPHSCIEESSPGNTFREASSLPQRGDLAVTSTQERRLRTCPFHHADSGNIHHRTKAVPPEL